MTLKPSRGNVALLFALLLPVLLGFAAYVIDSGHFYLVRNELQNAADAAALAGVRDLNGTTERFPLARAAAQQFGQRHDANGTDLVLQSNEGNAANGHIVLGNWDFEDRVFTVATAATPSNKVNAVQVSARRIDGDGGAVATYLAGILFGKTSQDIAATAIAVGGSPAAACSAPLAVTDCSVLKSDGSVKCDAELTFGQATTDTAGFTILSDSNPTTPTVTCMMARTLSQPCPKNCDCSDTCNEVETDPIKISNGNNLSDTSVTDINNAVAQAGGSTLYVTIPVVDSGGLTPGSCGAFNYNQPRAVVGYVRVRLLGATSAPNKSVRVTIDCTQSEPERPGGDFYGLQATNVYLVK